MRTIHAAQGHLGWNNSIEPVGTVAPGEDIEVEAADASGGQLTPDATAADIAALDLDRANPLTGPILVEGARPGDTLVVDILEMAPAGWGWTALIPGFGLLADDFADPHVVISTYDEDTLAFGDLARLPTRPFVGTIGVAPAEPGSHSVIPPRRVGGNMDCRDVRPGARLLLPVEVDGALLSLGDTHAAQGDGEVCGTAVETPATVRLRIDVRSDLAIDAPQLELPDDDRPITGPRHVTTGVGPDLYENCRDATRAMIEHLGRAHDLAPDDAYALSSVAAHLRVAEVVDAPNWLVTCDLPLDVLA